MKTKGDIRAHLGLLCTEARERASSLGYASDPGMVDGFGLTKYDCGLIITSLGQLLGYRVYGRAVWRDIVMPRQFVMPGQFNPRVDGPEVAIPYLDHAGSCSDYTWFDTLNRCVGVFETDGRDNRPSSHLREGTPVRIREHNGTNNLFKLSPPVLQKRFVSCPPIRVWILFQVDNAPSFRSKRPWVSTAEAWRSRFGRCPELDGSVVIRDTELFGDQFADLVARSI